MGERRPLSAETRLRFVWVARGLPISGPAPSRAPTASPRPPLSLLGSRDPSFEASSPSRASFSPLSSPFCHLHTRSRPLIPRHPAPPSLSSSPQGFANVAPKEQIFPESSPRKIGRTHSRGAGLRGSEDARLSIPTPSLQRRRPRPRGREGERSRLGTARQALGEGMTGRRDTANGEQAGPFLSSDAEHLPSFSARLFIGVWGLSTMARISERSSHLTFCNIPKFARQEYWGGGSREKETTQVICNYILIKQTKPNQNKTNQNKKYSKSKGSRNETHSPNSLLLGKSCLAQRSFQLSFHTRIGLRSVECGP